MTARDIEMAAPTVDLWLMAPVMRDPPLYTLSDLKTWVTLDDAMDAHEILNLEAMAAEKNRQRSQKPPFQG